MMDTLLVVVAAVSFALGGCISLWLLADSASEGCNGHRWGDAVAATDMGWQKREEVFGSKWKSDMYSTVSDHNKVELYVKAAKECQDCGEMKTTKLHLGNVTISAIRQPDESIAKGTNAVDVTHVASSPAELRNRLETVEGIAEVRVYDGSIQDDYLAE